MRPIMKRKFTKGNLPSWFLFEGESVIVLTVEGVDDEKVLSKENWTVDQVDDFFSSVLGYTITPFSTILKEVRK